MDNKTEVVTFTNKETGSMSWISQKEYDLWKELAKKVNERTMNCILWGKCPEDNRTEAEKYKDHLKWAWVVIDGQRKMLWVNNENNKAYQEDGHYGVVEPLQEVKYDKFERWCTTFDL